MKRTLCALVAAMFAVSAHAVEKRDPLALQLEAVAVQIKPGGERPTKTNVSIFLEARDTEQANSICERIRSFHEVVAVTSVDLIKKKIKYDSVYLEKKVRTAILYKFSSDKLLNVYVIAGHRRMGDGAKVIQMPGTTPRCRALDRIPLDILAYVRPKDGNALAFEPARMLEDGDYPMAISAIGAPTPIGPDTGGIWIMLAVGTAVAIGVGGAGSFAGLYFIRRRARRAAAEADRRDGGDRRGGNKGTPPNGVDKRESNDRRGGGERRSGAERRGGEKEANTATETDAETSGRPENDAGEEK